MAGQNKLANIALMLTLVGGQLPVLAQHNSSTPNFPRPGSTAPSSERTNSLERADTLNQQMIELYRAGRYQEAIPLAVEVLSIRREQFGERHPDVATSLYNLAVLYRAQNRYVEAESLYQQALVIRREQLGERHPAVATILNNLAALYRAQGRYGEAEPLLQQALAIRREQLGERHLDVATSLNNLAVLYDAQGRYVEAEPLYQQSLAIRREQLGERHLSVANILNNLAALYRAQGRYGETEPLLQQALSILREQFGEHHPDVATSLNNLAGLYMAQGRYGEVEPIYQQVLSIRREQLGERHPDVATSLNNLAGLYQAQGRYGEAEPLYQQALAIRREQLGERHPDVATSLNNLAELYKDQGRYGEAEPLYQRALPILYEQLGERHPSVATSLDNLAGLYQAQGRYGEAEPLYQQALAIRREQLGERHPDVATSLNSLAELYKDQGRYEEAESLLRESLFIRRERLGERHPDVAQSLNNLARLYQDQGRYRNTEFLYQQSLSIFLEQFGERHPSVAANLNNLAELFRFQGLYGEAESLYQQSLSIFLEQFGERHPSVATSLGNLALLYYAQGLYGESESLYQQSLDIRREQLGERHPDVATNLGNLANLYWAQGALTEALQARQAGLAIEEVNLGLNLATLAESQRQDYAATLRSSTDITLSLHLQGATESPEAAAMALTTLLRRKGRILDAGVDSVQRLRQNLDPSDQQSLDALTTLRQQLATFIFNSPPNLNRADIDRLETQINQLETDLARRSAVFRTENQAVEAPAVATQLPNAGVLVEYVRYFPFDPTTPQNPWGVERYAAYLLFPNGDIQAVDLGDAADIDGVINEFSKRLRDLGQTPSRAARALAIHVFEPLLPYLSDREHLLIAPDGQLNRIPFDALRTAENRYLIQDYQISYLNSGRDLLKLDVTEPSQQPAVIVANPDYDEANSNAVQIASHRRSGERSTELTNQTFGPLPGTAAEAMAIQAEFEASNAPITPLIGEAATENALKQVEAPSILHLATHGFFLSDIDLPQSDGDRGLGVISADTPVEQSPSSVAVENPLLRSGLALAGANPRESGSEDGILTALEASSLNLSGTQLVVLSACDTGLGDIANGEGVYGLRRAFAIAGAETQVLSLWQVDDVGTSDLMGAYYEKLLDGMGRAEALREVQLELINSRSIYAHPFYWAAFITTGDWRPLE